MHFTNEELDWLASGLGYLLSNENYDKETSDRLYLLIEDIRRFLEDNPENKS